MQRISSIVNSEASNSIAIVKESGWKVWESSAVRILDLRLSREANLNIFLPRKTGSHIGEEHGSKVMRIRQGQGSSDACACDGGRGNMDKGPDI
jgi:hypothetical protein